jgi:hypothetical protein
MQQFIQANAQFTTVAILPSKKPLQICVSILKTKTFDMKHLGFTIQFLLLLIAIPALMYVELTRDDKKQTKDEKETSVEVALSQKTSAPMERNVVSFGLIN